ncbi:iron-containing alcohol dehydrogenase, partial [Mesorhizobium sp. M1121]
MTRTFTYSGSPAHIVFGNGASSEVGTWIEKLGCNRALVLSTPHRAADGEALAKSLGALAAGTFSGAAMHTRVEVTLTAMAKATEV